MTDQPEIDDTARASTTDGSAGEQVLFVFDDVRALIRAELNYFSSRLDYTRHVVKWSFRFGAIAAFAFTGAAIALAMGTVLTLARYIGPGWATVVVTVCFVTLGLVSAFKARNWVKRVYFPEINENDDNMA